MQDRHNFDSLACYYDLLAKLVFGKSIQKAQTYFLDQIPAKGRILVLGGGTGWWLNEALRDRPEISLLYIDSSAEMIARAKANSDNDDRITFRNATEESLTVFDQFDVVITFFYLDLFEDEKLKTIIKNIKLNLKNNGYWLAADFKEQSRWHKILLFIMYRFFRVTTGIKNQSLPQWEGIMLESGVEMLDQRLYYGRFIQSGLYRNL